MLGLVILFFLGLWILITIIATVAGARKKGSKGAFIGFMLTMGGPITYWIGEFVYIQHTVNQLCNNEGGMTVYVTPEEWRKQIGEEEWEKQIYVNKTVHSRDKDKMTVIFKGRKYHPLGYVNPRIIALRNLQHSGHEITKVDFIYYDINSKQVLFRQITYGVITSTFAVSGDGLKVWLNSIDDCDRYKLPESIRFFAINKYTNLK